MTFAPAAPPPVLTRVVIGRDYMRAVLVDGPAHGTVYVVHRDTWHLYVADRDPALPVHLESTTPAITAAPLTRHLYERDHRLEAQPRGHVAVFVHAGRTTR